MPILPPEHGVPAEPEHRESHQYREVAESFGADAARYDRTRPSYPDALVQQIMAVSPGPDVLDVGCGTGIAARLFLAAGGRVLGVDPDDRMAARARLSGIPVEVATFETWDPAGRGFDTVIAAQAWHWVDPVAGAAKAAQALRLGGQLAVFWNSFLPPPELSAAMGTALSQVMVGRTPSSGGMPGPDGYTQLCAKAADGMRQTGAFGEPQPWRVDWQRSYTRDEWLDQIPTFGGMGQRLPAPVLQELLDRVGATIDALGGRFTMGYATVAVSAARQ